MVLPGNSVSLSADESDSDRLFYLSYVDIPHHIYLERVPEALVI